MQRCLSAWGTLVLALLLANGCADRSTPDRADDRPQRGGTLVLAAPTDLETANGLLAGEKLNQEVNRYLLFLPLIRHAPDFSYVPALARSWELQGDTAAVFRLRPDVRWHDGVPTRARDVVFTFDRVRDTLTAYPNAEFFAAWTDVEELDSLTVRFRFARHFEPLAGLPSLPIMPAHMLDTVPPARLRQAAFNHHPVGNGPFRFVEYRAGDRWVFEANDDFPAELGGRPWIDRVVWRVIPDNTAAVTELQTGTVDVLLIPPADQFVALDSIDGITGMVKPSHQYAFIGWNHRRGVLRDPRVRRALSQAVDRSDVLRTIRSGYGELAVGPIAPQHWAFDSTLTPLPYSPDSARALLASAGIVDRNQDGKLELPDGSAFRIELKFPATSTPNRDLAALIDSDLREIGVEIEQRPTDFGTMVQDFTGPQRNFDAILLAWESDVRANLRDIFHSAAGGGPFQLAGYSNARVDTLIDRIQVSRSRAEALPLYRELQQILRAEQPWTFLYYYPELFLLRDRVRGVRMDLRGALVNVAEWWLSGAAGGEGMASPGDSADRSPAPAAAPAR
jgi:peptide/nickel transport system substrate-binding protein